MVVGEKYQVIRKLNICLKKSFSPKKKKAPLLVFGSLGIT